MIYTDGFNKIASPFQWVKSIFEEVFNGEDTTEENFYEGSCDGLINEQIGNYRDEHGVDYTLTKRQKDILRKRWIRLKLAHKTEERLKKNG